MVTASENAHCSHLVAQVLLIDQRACKSLGCWNDAAEASSEETGTINQRHKELTWPEPELVYM